MKDYDAERQAEHARNAEVRARIEAAGVVLKFKAEARDPDCRVNLHNDAGEDIHCNFSAGYGDKRIKVSGNYPRNADGTWPGTPYATSEERGSHDRGLDITQYGEISAPGITISPDKTPEQIARDIEKRFLPAYREYKKRLQAVINAHDDYEAKTVAALAALKGAALTEYEIKERKVNIDGRKVKGQEYTPYANVRASREDITLEIRNLNPDQARRILAIIK